MDDVLIIYLVMTGLAGLLAAISIWTPRKSWLKFTALVTTSLFLPAAYLGLVHLLSRPKPADLEWLHRQLPQATVISARMAENQGIYLWLELEGVEEPRAYALPWSQELARQIHQAQRAAEKRGSAVKMAKPFQRSLDNREKKFFAAPQEPLPAKQPMVQNPMEFQNRSSRDSLLTAPDRPEASNLPFIRPTPSRPQR